LADILPRLLGSRCPETTIKRFGWIGGIILTLFLPISYPILIIWQKLTPNIFIDNTPEADRVAKQEILEMIEDVGVSDVLEPQEKKMFESFVTFRDRIAREVMVPRIDTFALPADISIAFAAQRLQEEGYSRTPVYRETIDEIVGVLMYKDILTRYMEAFHKQQPALLDAPIESILKPVLYTPETKKISHLLQEFRNKQMHIAIVVDEYGGTEGIVTIEDILEEIVGEIEDEYDTEESLVTMINDHEWLVDARISLIDLSEETGIVITDEGDYDTLGGYLFQKAGSIPSKGFLVRNDLFDIEVISSSDRNVRMVKLLMHNAPPPSHQEGSY
jgi:Hemolysins and related proteins containing CBS domains